MISMYNISLIDVRIVEIIRDDETNLTRSTARIVGGFARQVFQEDLFFDQCELGRGFV